MLREGCDKSSVKTEVPELIGGTQSLAESVFTRELLRNIAKFSVGRGDLSHEQLMQRLEIIILREKSRELALSII